MNRILAVLAVFLLAPAGAHAAPDYQKLPTATAGAASTLKLKIDRYSGSTNGGMLVTVKNTGRSAEIFTAQGLYFVPAGDPEEAPQRLGAAGPFDERVGDAWVPREAIEVPAGAERALRVQVFCVDSHRSSPSSRTKFSLADQRLPKELRTEIEAGTKTILRNNKKKSASEASGDVQSYVWKTRNKKWVPLQGERSDEKASSPRSNEQRIERNVPRQKRIRRIED